MTSARSRLIEDYLRRLDTASAFLAPDRRRELRQEIREHIDAAMDEFETLDADAVRGILERLGPPAEIVAAELGPRTADSVQIPIPTAPPLPPAPAARPAPATASPAFAAPGAEAAPPAFPAPGPAFTGGPAGAWEARPPGRTTRRTLLTGGAVAAAVVAVVVAGVTVMSTSTGPSTYEVPADRPAASTPPFGETVPPPPAGVTPTPSEFTPAPGPPTAGTP